MLAKDTPVDRADVHGDIERASEPFGIFVFARVPLGAVKNSVSENDYVLFCTAAIKRKELED